MSTVGGVEVDSVKDLPQLLKTVVDLWKVPGLSGYGAQTLSLGDGEFEFSIFKYVTGHGGLANNNTAANGLIDSLTALQGTVVGIVDDWGDSYENILIVDGTVAAKKPCIYLGDPGSIRVQVNFKAVNSSYPGRSA